MKIHLLRPLVGLAFGLFPLPMSAQTAAAASTAFQFPRADLMTIGAYYYPKAWPAAQWPRDHANIKQLGLQHSRQFVLPTVDEQPQPDSNFELVTSLVVLPADGSSRTLAEARA